MINEIKNTQLALELLGVNRRIKELEESGGDRFYVSGGGSSDGGGSITIQEQDGAPTGTVTTLKVTNGTLTDDGSGVFSLATGSTAPGGSNTHLQFNDGGAFGGSANLTYDKINQRLQLNGKLGVNTAPLTKDIDIIPSVVNYQRVWDGLTYGEEKYLGSGTSSGGTETILTINPLASNEAGHIVATIVIQDYPSYSASSGVMHATYVNGAVVGTVLHFDNYGTDLGAIATDIDSSGGSIRVRLTSLSGALWTVSATKTFKIGPEP